MTDLVINRSAFLGFLIGIFLVLAVFETKLIAIPVAIWWSVGRFRTQKKLFPILICGFYLLGWIACKGLLIEGFSSKAIQEVFPILILCLFACLHIERSVFKGIFLALMSIAFLDSISNVLQLFFDIDLFGQGVEHFRVDGVRTKGIFGNSFYSLSLSLSVLLLYLSWSRKGRFEALFYFLLGLVGALRSFILILLLFFRRFIVSGSWFSTFGKAILISTGIYLATILSLHWGVFEEGSGNYYRLVAWRNALQEIAVNPLIGSLQPIPKMPESFAITVENLIRYRIYESKLLQDAVFYGLPFTCLKIFLFYLIGQKVFREDLNSMDLLRDIKRFLAAFLIVDYMVFSFFGMPILTVVISAILFSDTADRL